MKKIQNFFSFRPLGGEISRLAFALEENKKISVLGMGETLKIVSLAQTKAPILYLTSDYLLAKKVKSEFDCLFDNVALFPIFSDNLIYKKAQTITINREKMAVLCDIVLNKTQVIVASIDSLLGFLPPKDLVLKNIIKITNGQECSLTEFKSKLANIGYTKSEVASVEGTFSSRGDIVDIFLCGQETSTRIEFFDDYIEKIYSLNEDNSIKKKLDELIIYPNTEILFEKEDLNNAISYLSRLKIKAENAKLNQTFINNLSEVISRLNIEDKNFSLSYILSLFQCDSLLSYLPPDTIIVIDEAKMCYDYLINTSAEIEMRFKNLVKEGTVINPKSSGCFKSDGILSELNKFMMVAHQKINNANRFFSPDIVANVRSIPMGKYYHDFDNLVKDIENWKFNGFDVFIFGQSEKSAIGLNERFEENGLFLSYYQNETLTSSGQVILPFKLDGGFILPDQKKVVIGSSDIFPPERKKATIHASRKNVFAVPKAGDYVVHSFHGIGICEGITNLSSNFGSKDFVVVRYRDNDKLYVPIDGLNELERFSGAQTPAKLSKIGGVEFSHIKEKVKKEVKKLAFDLLELYAKREAKKGFTFSPDNAMQREFEDSFPYIETEDQLKSNNEIKKDMVDGKLMDRLLCGDVGFGKTEVAMRAMFKCVLDNKQVAFLAPTTILSQQHYNTLKSRMSEFGVNIEVLNRFKTASEVKRILNDLKHGRVDIICGTHRLLSEDVVFNDLGLVVLDEEQKFGVNDKEKLKNKYPSVDFLTLSATPIPRTLHMSLSGIRDISIINTPPNERIPVITSVCEYSEVLLRDAILREMARGGQVFILYNKVEKIYSFAEKIRKVVPEAKMLVGHGQLNGKELEDVIYSFYKGEADVLICSTIIENGIDIPNANTLIVYDSDKFGLSQLYQIRGRVGRSSRTAYAYFTYEPDKVLSEEAGKRLEALSEFCEFGSGFKIAMKDLEIRGSGNVLGAEQHGFMQKVGYDMYAKLLSEAISELKGEKVKEKVNTLMHISIDAFISDGFIKDSSNRMMVYKNISSISSKEEKDEMLDDLSNTFGKVPQETVNLVLIAYARYLASLIEAKEVISTSTGIKIIFDSAEKITNNSSIGEGVYVFRNECALDLGQTPMIKIDADETGEKNLNKLIKFLEICQKSKKH